MTSRRVRENRRTLARVITAGALLTLTGFIPALTGTEPADAATPVPGNGGAPVWLLLIPILIIWGTTILTAITLALWVERRHGWRREHLRAIRTYMKEHR